MNLQPKVGLRTIRYYDESRQSWNGNGPRPLLTDVWYPAVSESVETQTIIGTKEAPLFRVGRAARDAAALAGSFPLVLLSHGTGGSALQMGWLGSELARSGFIAAGLNHHGNNALEPFTPEGFLMWWERATDLSATIDRLCDDPFFAPHVDRSRIGAAGFSLGGYTVIEAAGGVLDLKLLVASYDDPIGILLKDIPEGFPGRPALVSLAHRLLDADESHERSYRDPRLRAIFAIAPALASGFSRDSLAGVRVPVRIVVGEADDITPPDETALRYAELLPNAEATVLDGGVAHYTFLGEGTEIGRREHPELCVDLPGVDRGAVHRGVARMASEFFRTRLGAEAPAARRTV